MASSGLYGLITASKASFDLNGLISASMASSGLYGLIMTFTVTIRPKRPYPDLRGHTRPQRPNLGLHDLKWPLRPYPGHVSASTASFDLYGHITA